MLSSSSITGNHQTGPSPWCLHARIEYMKSIGHTCLYASPTEWKVSNNLICNGFLDTMEWECWEYPFFCLTCRLLILSLPILSTGPNSPIHRSETIFIIKISTPRDSMSPFTTLVQGNSQWLTSSVGESCARSEREPYQLRTWIKRMLEILPILHFGQGHHKRRWRTCGFARVLVQAALSPATRSWYCSMKLLVRNRHASRTP